MKKTILLAAVLAPLMLVASCKCGKKECKNEEPAGEPVAFALVEPAAASFYGTYEGVLPAADCDGFKTTLTINEDTTYKLVSVALDEKAEEIVTSGVYEKQGGDLLVLITPSSGNKTYYKILENAVALTDETGTLAEGELADYYILKKK